MADILNWFKALPPFTRAWFGGTIALSLVARFGIIPPDYLILDYQSIFHNFQIWRFVTALFFYPITPQTGFHFLINLFFVISYSKLLETGQFVRTPADYAFMLLFSWFWCVIAALLMDMMVLMDPMIICILYVWCNLNQNVIITFWFGTQFAAIYLPWVLLGFNLILSGNGVAEIMGIIVGHLYYFLKFEYPTKYGGPSLLETPSFLKTVFPPPAPPGGTGGGGAAGGGGGGGGGGIGWGGHSWGSGQALGGG